MPAVRAPSMVLRENKRHERLVFPGLFVLPRLPSFPPVFPDVAACPSAAALVHDQPATFARRDAAKLAALVDLYDDNGEAIPAVPAVATPASIGTIRYAGPIEARNAAQAPTEQPCLSAADIAEGGGCYGCLSCTNAGLGVEVVCYCGRGAAGPGQAGCERKQPPVVRALRTTADVRRVVRECFGCECEVIGGAPGPGCLAVYVPHPVDVAEVSRELRPLLPVTVNLTVLRMVTVYAPDATPAKPAPLPRPERVEPWQVWLPAAGISPALILSVHGNTVGVAYRIGTASDWGIAPADMNHRDFLGWFKPRIGSRTWTSRGPLLPGPHLVTEDSMLDPTNGDWLPDGNPTDADIAEWRETWGRT